MTSRDTQFTVDASGSDGRVGVGVQLTQEHSIGELLRNAVLAQRAGRLAEAESGFHEVLRHRPGEPRALYCLGLLAFHRGDQEGGIRCLQNSLRGNPGNARAWNALGGMYIAAGRAADAKDAYRRATETEPAGAEGWYNLGICRRNEGDFEGAVSSLREAIARESDYSRAHKALGMLLYQLGRLTESAKAYADWSAQEPSSATARHMAAAVSGHDSPSRASDEYVRELFDESAESFDTNLAQLDYRAPNAVVSALRQRAEQKFPAVLDAGCGTGLCGPLLRPLCEHLAGVDISPKMIERARARECYDELVACELTAYLQRRGHAFDAVVCVDTLVYFGALEPVLAAASEALSGAGWLIFTLEALKANAIDDYRLEIHGRYTHSEHYIRSALAAAHLRLDALTPDTFRREREQHVAGFLVVARRN